MTIGRRPGSLVTGLDLDDTIKAVMVAALGG